MRKVAKVLIIIAYVILLVFFVPLVLYPISVSILMGRLPSLQYIEFMAGEPFRYGGRGLIISIVWLAQFCLFGIIAHILMSKDLKKGASFTDGEKFLWVISYLPFAVPFILLLAAWAILKFIDIMIGLFTGGNHSLKGILDFILESAGFKQKTKVVIDSESSAPTYTVHGEGGHVRTLTLVSGYEEDWWKDSPYHGKTYSRLIDDLGNYWRSYDENQTFIEEKHIPNNLGTYVG